MSLQYHQSCLARKISVLKHAEVVVWKFSVGECLVKLLRESTQIKLTFDLIFYSYVVVPTNY